MTHQSATFTTGFMGRSSLCTQDHPSLYRPQLGRSRGASVLVMLMLLLGLASLGLVWAQRHLIFVQLSVQNDSQASRAWHAAEAGLAWAQARLNIPLDPLTPCHPLRFLPAAGGRPVRCQQTQGAWHCQCSQEASLPPTSEDRGPVFSVSLSQHEGGRRIDVSARACSEGLVGCNIESAPVMRQSLRRAGGLLHLPSSALIAGGSIQPSERPMDTLSKITPAQTVPPRASETPWRFESLFGVSKQAWSDQPAVLRLNCPGRCAAADLGPITREPTVHMVHLATLDVSGPVTLGAPDHPVLLVVDQEATLRGAVTFYGVLIAARIRSDSTHGQLTVQGALVSESDILLGSGAQIHYNRELLDRLRMNSGSYIRQRGSWNDS